MTAQRSHNDIYREIGANSQQIENLELRADDHDRQLGEIKSRVDSNGVMTVDALTIQRQMAVDIAAIKAKVMAYDMMRERLIGWLAGWAVGIGALWFLIKDKIGAFFGASP